jgi:hypothetical protein
MLSDGMLNYLLLMVKTYWIFDGGNVRLLGNSIPLNAANIHSAPITAHHADGQPFLRDIFQTGSFISQETRFPGETLVKPVDISRTCLYMSLHQGQWGWGEGEINMTQGHCNTSDDLLGEMTMRQGSRRSPARTSIGRPRQM